MVSLEVKRQLFHLFFGVLLVFLLYFELIGLGVLVLALCFGFLISLLSKHFKLPIISWFLRNFERTNARFPGEGAFFLVASTTLVIAIFPREIALASLMILAFGDAFSHLLGKAYGKTKFAHKTLFGTISGIIFGYMGAIFFVAPSTAFIGSGFAMFYEAFNFKILNKKIDDNLFIPVVSSILMYIWVSL